MSCCCGQEVAAFAVIWTLEWGVLPSPFPFPWALAGCLWSPPEQVVKNAEEAVIPSKTLAPEVILLSVHGCVWRKLLIPFKQNLGFTDNVSKGPLHRMHGSRYFGYSISEKETFIPSAGKEVLNLSHFAWHATNQSLTAEWWMTVGTCCKA